MHRPKRTLPVSLAAWLFSLGFAGAAPPSGQVDFKRQIEPILVKRCSECHGPDQQKSGLRLDSHNAALQGGKSGRPALVAGRSAESELFKRVTSADPDEVMPPKGERLTGEQIGALQAWIDQGAVWPAEKDHWAFVKPTRPEPPAGKEGAEPRQAIDAFVLRRLAQEGLAPSPAADRATLIRRLSLDLTGLPPSLEEIEAFQEDQAPNAYERLVDRLLASPHFGEHYARWWLDLARYADSNGYQVDSTRSIWPYRDWVIDAFNRNLPFDQFTVEQLAGDLLPQATLEQKIATGFCRNSKINDEGGGDEEEYRTKAVKDRATTTATTWLGLTMMCAECHSHKYDPITQEDYYRFYAFFNNTADKGNYTVEPTLPVPPPPVQCRVDYLRSGIARVKADLAAAEENLPAEQAAWEERMRGKGRVWTTLTLAGATSTGGSTYTNLPDQSILAQGVNPIYDTIIVEAETDLAGITAVLLEVLPDPALPHQGPGRWDRSGNFILDELALTSVPRSDPSAKPLSHFFRRARADWEQIYYRAEHAVDRNPKTGWAIAPRFGQPHLLIAELRDPAGHAGGTKLTFRFEHYHGNSHTIGRLRLSVTTEKDPGVLWPVPVEIRTLLELPVTERGSEEKERLAGFYRTVSPAIRRLEHELFRLNQREAELAGAKYTTLVMQELPQPRQAYIHVRGNFLDRGEEVAPGVPAFLPPLPPEAGPNRLGLARWLVSSDNPLTARVTANRLWERLFGVGLVKTSEDFGRQGERPSHPELLDWLACEFMEPRCRDAAAQAPHPWDIKHLLKLMVMSATYRRTSAATDDLLAKDLYNRLLARGPRFRMDAEMIRDNALAIAGLLNREVGGPSVYPVQVPNLWKEIGFLRPEIGMDEWPVSEGPELYRRGVYTFWRRVCTYPTFATFDAPSRDVCVSRRMRTNTPLQALAGLNETTFLEAARVFAQRIMLQGGQDPEHQIRFAFRLATARPPTQVELDRLLRFYRQQLGSFQNAAEEAARLVDVGTAERPADLDLSRLAAWMMVANVLLNLDETITKG